MKKLSLFIFTSILAAIGYSQQFPLQSQYQFNYATINPAASGENDFYRARASFRDQWVGLTDDPISTQILTVTKGFGDNGLGITVFSDKTGGLFSKSGASLSYSHKVKFNESNLFLGISAGTAKINLAPNDDLAIISNSDVIPDFTFGVYYIYKNIKFGVSVPGLLNANMEVTGSSQNTLDRHFYTVLSFEEELSEDWSVHPSVLIKTTANNSQIDANLNFKLKNKLWFGTSYRQDFGPTIYVGIDFGKLLSVYSYDISTNEVANYSNGSHEFTLGYDFISNSEADDKNKESNYTNDIDNDGIADEKDLCPEEYGVALSNGCPDFDKDGIPDKYDLCPHLFGNLNTQGCPELAANESMILSTALKDLNFDFDKAVIKYESKSALTNLAILMLRNSDMILFIEGHASTEGEVSYNLNLSARRAKEVQKFFISRGVKKARLIIDFYGEESPLNLNVTDIEKAKNRRVEFDLKYHLYDASLADNLMNEFDSLLNKINGVNTFSEEKQNIEVLQEKQKEVIAEVNEQELNIEVLQETQKEVIAEVNEQELNIEVLQETQEEVNAEVNEEELVEDFLFDTIVEKEVIEEIVFVDKDISNKYLVVVQVFSDKNNAIGFSSANDVTELQYVFLNEKYYVYAFASEQRENAETFRDEYQKGCWILDL